MENNNHPKDGHHAPQHHISEEFKELSLQKAESLSVYECNVCYNLMVEPCDLLPFCKHKYCI